MKVLPESLICIDEIMSNFDHEIEPDAETELRKGNCYGEYTAMNFFGLVWFDGQFNCMVKQYRNHVNTISRDSLQEIMDACCESYGKG